MSNIDLSIGGRSFKVACAAGEEEHVASLGRMIDAKVASVPGAAGQSEARMLLFASLMLADEVHEAQNRSGSVPAPQAPVADPALAERLEALAATLEKCATALEA
ncbi:cell division protein ZapA [Novosphingobium sp. TH158]|uniref:cell division protein ZapA n=1 Tax=Novosphingobium sp. TH158 TaxID=2067455 RepID=UPI000C7B2653|nr:cell division protein ZapA [Novosphingobium sp. TH158]PLK26033.1 cell division protein ZapA [Novosphingobium sp. TH158]